MTSIMPSDHHRGQDFGQHTAGSGVHMHYDPKNPPLTDREQATLDALVQIDKQFGKKDLAQGELDKLEQYLNAKKAKKAQGPIQTGKNWVNSIKKQHVSPNWNTHISSNPGYANISMPSTTSSIDTLKAIQALIRLTAKSADITAGFPSGQTVTTTVTWDNDGLQRFYALCQKSGAKGTVDPSYDLEILEEQTTEVGDQFSEEFKRGLKAAVAVLLEGKHLEEFLS